MIFVRKVLKGPNFSIRFVAERIQKEDKNLWSKMKRRKLLTKKSTNKKTKVTVNNEVIELQEDPCLFALMMMVCQARPEINIEEAIGKYEFSVVSRTLFAADSTMLHCSTKSALMTLIDKDISTITLSNAPTTAPLMRNNVVVVDGMAELQSLKKAAPLQPAPISPTISQTNISRSTVTVMKYTWFLTGMTLLFLSSLLPEKVGKAIKILYTTEQQIPLALAK